MNHIHWCSDEDEDGDRDSDSDAGWRMVFIAGYLLWGQMRGPG